MAVKLQDLYDSVKDEDITLIAGKEGMSNVVRWVHMVENEEISTFLDGKEVAFTTGIGLKDESELINLVKLNYENDASGMVINIGPFIKEISQEIKDFCNEKNFPLFEVPWHVHMARIMRVFCFEITESEKINLELISAMKNAIFFAKQEELYIPQLARRNFQSDWGYSVAIIQLQGTKKLIETRKDNIIKNIENSCVILYPNTIVFELEGNIIIVFAQYNEKRIKEIINDFNKRFIISVKGLKGIIAIGQLTKNIKCIGKSYKQAHDVIALLNRKKNKNEIVAYRDLGLYKLFMAIDDNAVMKEYYAETLETLQKYDDLNDTDYTKVLEIYLSFSGSVKETSEALFVHRNTINYKINKIEEILGCDLSNLNTRLKYSIAYMIKELI